MLDTGPECPHGFPAWRITRAGEPVCPHCRRTARAAGLTPTAKAPRRPAAYQPTLALDVRALAANDHDDQPVADVIPLTRARRTNR